MTKSPVPKIKDVAQTPQKPIQYLTVRDVAIVDQVSEKTVRRAIDAGLLDVERVGPGKRLIRIHPDAHAAYRRGGKA
ncbi:helix-turn-helix domain-containing protein [Roseovarius aestuariivivens]|uniref:helix-turn-helix domain-containing protein n=1 Tax=Roseovarius aestuariivivens TaxID=1888910 RepID=UPI001436BD1F|nr:helix-turn-helix domain-containing protein [Roseovarius aestuariivivens]